MSDKARLAILKESYERVMAQRRRDAELDAELDIVTGLDISTPDDLLTIENLGAVTVDNRIKVRGGTRALPIHIW